MNPHILRRVVNGIMWSAWALTAAIFAITGDWYVLLVLMGAGYAGTYA